MHKLVVRWAMNFGLIGMSMALLWGSVLGQYGSAAAETAATTYTYLPVIKGHHGSRHIGVFIPLVNSTTWAGQVDSFVTLTGRDHGIHLVSSGFGCHWANDVVDFRQYLDYVHTLGATPLITWMPMDCSNGGFGNVNALGLPDILNGTWDNYIKKWATDIGALGYPVFVRWGHEMNIPSYSWGGQHAFGTNGRTKYDAVTEGCGLLQCYGSPALYDGPERFIAAYRRVHDLANPLAPNIVWLWNPNARNWPLQQAAGWNQYNNYYPGNAYVDWVGLDGYNWGDRSGNGYGRWVTFDEMFGAELNNLAQLYPSKPQLIPEFAAVEDEVNPNRKAAFIRDAYQAALKYPLLRGLVWVQDNGFYDALRNPPGVVDFRVNSSSASLQAYREALGAWASNAPLP